eukprot:CAMPEP_0177294000 /NCGR_PEP_ID=MMETSP0368-20130122/1077_1 /TAXON_ID=447022 ORGANISM="Scrippsiella hangoei-like, Strain SHHI-4" /NCGR_SAMPLE_ID=MMETSP0368 /ASSEMBLY_ACC=CAM_ASM_000363 /LENGTH=119 /DNA_ID=CAMNT_0018751873 /DNA_START=402 /DNA_END=762 /DNA_ORIENTATION=-
MAIKLRYLSSQVESANGAQSPPLSVELKALLGIRVCHGGKLGAPLGDAGGRALKGRWRAPDVGLRPPPVSASRAILIVISRSFTAIRRRVAAALIGRIIGGAPSSTGMTSFFAAAGAWD